MADTKYTVKGLMAIVNCDNGTAVHLQHGAPVPSNADPAHVQHLLDQGLIEPSKFVGGLEPVRTGDLQQLTFRTTDGAEASGGGDVAGAIPAKSAVKDDWVAYAVSQGAAQVDAEGLTKDQLIEQYGQS